MNRNLWKKAVVIGAVVLVSILGLIGLPTSGESLTENLRESIRLGLDLRGGTHLVLQVRVNDAVNAEIDLTIERLRATLDREQIDYGGITPVNADEIQDTGGILVQGIPLEQTAAFRDIVEQTEFNWTVQQVEPGLLPDDASNVGSRRIDGDSPAGAAAIAGDNPKPNRQFGCQRADYPGARTGRI